MTSSTRILGLLAGGGDLPVLVAQGARAQGCRVITSGLMGETAPALRALSDVFEEVKIGHLGAVVRLFKEHHANECVMVGTFPKTNLFGRVGFDLTLLQLLARVGRQLQDDKTLREVTRLFESEGFPVKAVPPFIPDHMAPQGVLTKRQPTPDEQDDITYGMTVARATGALDVGQTVVVRRGVVLAVEGVEGTDRSIERGALLGKSGGAGGKGGVVVCKVVKPHQDLRLDLPAVGPRTVATCADHKVRVLAFEAHRTIMVDREKTIAEADRRKLVLVGVPLPAGVELPPWAGAQRPTTE